MDDRGQVKKSRNLNPLIGLCNYLAILPPNSKSCHYNVYAIILQVTLVCIFLYSAYGKETPTLDTYSAISKTIDQIASLFLTLANVTSISITSFCYPNKFRKLLKDLTNFDNRVSVRRKERNVFWICVVVFHSLMGTIIILDLWFWIGSVSLEIYKYYMTKSFQFYHLNLTVMLVFWMTMEFHYRFKHLNKSLEIISRKLCRKNRKNYQCKEHVDEPLFSLTKYECKDVKYIAKMHNVLCNVLNDFNVIFGFIILFAVVFFITYIVHYSIELINYSVLGKKINGVTFALSFQIIVFSGIFQCMVTLLSLAAAGYYLSFESAKTSNICYNILNTIPVQPRQDLELLRGELKLLADQVSCRSPSLNASGFFVVNFTMIGFIVTSVTSYIIVAIQFLT